MMVLVFGSSASATTAILTAFFCGIAFGSKLGGKLLTRWKKALLFYALTELWICLWGLSVPGLLRVISPLYVDLLQRGDPDPMMSLVYRFLMSILVILPATLGMGATIPVMNRLLTERCGGVGRGVAMAYGINTAGAVLGCLVTGFLLIRVFGMQATLYTAAALNALVVAAALLLSRREFASLTAEAPVSSRRKEQKDRGEELPQRKARLLVGIYAATGFLALGFEILWLRILGIYNTNSFATFTLALSIYLLGFSLGSIALFPFLARRFRAIDIFKIANLGTAAVSLASLRLIYSFPRTNRFLLTLAKDSESYLGQIVVGREALFSFLVVFFPTVCMGLAYPALCAALISRKEKTGEQSGHYYFVGNLGSIGGILTVGFLLVPKLGLVGTLALLCALGSLLVLLTQILDREAPERLGLAFRVSAAALIVASVSYGFWGHPFNAAGPVLFREGYWEQARPGDGSRRSVIRRYQEGPTATVLVREERRDGAITSRSILVDEQKVASTHRDAQVDAKMLAHLPLLLHRDPKRALTVGFGSGTTSWSMTRHDVDVEVVEIEPEVLNSAYLFDDYNHNVLADPKLKAIINDARDYLGLTGLRYDVISTDVNNMRYKQNSNLYTKEYFSIIRDRLTDDGIACAWVPLSGITEEDFKMVLRTFNAVFTHTSVWYMNNATTNFVLFLGTPERLTIDLPLLKERFYQPAVLQDLQTIGVFHPFQFVHFMHLEEEGVREYTGSGSLHTDNRPVLEFSSPSSMYFAVPLMAMNLKGTLPFRPDDYRPYVSGLDEKDEQLFDKAALASRLWTDTISLYFLAITGEHGPDEKGFLREAIGTSRAALNIFSFEREDQGYLRHFLRLWGNRPGPAYARLPSEGLLREDFDGAGTLPFQGRIGVLPFADPVPVDRSHRKTGEERFLLASGLERGVGIGGSYALTLRNTEEGGSVAHVLPLVLEEAKPFTIEFWSRSAMTGEGGVGAALLEFDRVTMNEDGTSPGKVSEKPTRIRETRLRHGMWDWGKARLDVEPYPSTKMVHLVFYRVGPSGIAPVIIDDIEIRTSPGSESSFPEVPQE
jgi:spermidine synthase